LLLQSGTGRRPERLCEQAGRYQRCHIRTGAETGAHALTPLSCVRPPTGTSSMVEFLLPKNSRIKPGKVWPRPDGATRVREYRVYRYDPDTGENPRLDTFYVDLDDCGP